MGLSCALNDPQHPSQHRVKNDVGRHSTEMRSQHGRFLDQGPVIASLAERAVLLKTPGPQARDACALAECGRGGTAGRRCGPPARLGLAVGFETISMT
jgi:hypothetical protein